MNLTRQSLAASPFHLPLALSAIVLAALAQYARTFLEANNTAIGFFVAAVIAWVLAILIHPGELGTRLGEAAPLPTARGRRVYPGFYLGLAVMAAVTFLTSGDNAYTFDNLAAWMVSVALVLYTFWEPERSWDEWKKWLDERQAAVGNALQGGFRLSSRLVLLALIMLVGVFFYFYNLDGVPGEMDSDHAEKVLDVNDVVNHDVTPIFFERNTGREPLEFYLIAALAVVGQHPIDYMALKLVTATMGLLVIPATYLFAAELFDDRVALLAAAFVAISKWPVTIARMGLRFPFTPVFIAPFLYFLFRALKYRRRNDFLMAGLFLGAGLYGYNAFRIAPVLAGILIVLWAVVHRMDWAQLRPYVLNSLLIFLFAFVILMPLFRYSVDHPENFWFRVLTRLSTVERGLPDNPVKILGGNVVNTALMFNWAGDQAWPNSIPGDPALDYVSGGLFLFGLVYALYRLVHYGEWTYLFLLIALAILLLPSTLSLAFPNENPSNARTGGAVPLVFIVTALPVAWLMGVLSETRSRATAMAFAGALLAVIATVNYVRYFRDFDASYRQLSWNSDEVAQVIRGFADSVGDYEHAYIMLYPHWIDTRNVAINMGQIGWDQTLPNAEAVRAQTRDASNKLYIFNENDSTNLAQLQDILPNGQLRKFHSRTPGHDFSLWYVPGTIAPEQPLVAK